MKKLILLALSMVCAAGVYAAEFPDISIGEVKDAIASKKVVLLDVNGPDSYQAGHVPGALDFTAVQDKLSTVLPKDKNALVVAYCGNPKCPAYRQAAEAAKKLGYTNVKHMVAGIQGWKQAGEKTEAGGKG